MSPGTGMTHSADPELILQLQKGDLDALGGLCASISFLIQAIRLGALLPSLCAKES